MMLYIGLRLYVCIAVCFGAYCNQLTGWVAPTGPYVLSAVFSCYSFGRCLVQVLGPCCWRRSSLHVQSCSSKLPELYGKWHFVLSSARMLSLPQVGCCTLVANTRH